MIKKFSLVLLLLCSCNKGPDNDGLQAHEQKGLDILEHYLEAEEVR